MGKDNKALIIVDVQAEFINKYTVGKIELINELLERFDGIKIAVKSFNDNDSPLMKLGIYSRPIDKRGNSLDKEVLTKANYIMLKDRYSACGNDLMTLINDRSIGEVYVVGFDTDACVMATVLDLVDNGVKTYVIEDCCASSGGPEYHEYGMMLLKRNLGQRFICRLNDIIDN
jgi:nicotinamidase-related amidase